MMGMISILSLQESGETTDLVAYTRIEDAQAALAHLNSRLRQIWDIWPDEDALRHHGYPDAVAPMIDEIFALFPAIPQSIRDDLCYLAPSRNNGTAEIEFFIKKLDLR